MDNSTTLSFLATLPETVFNYFSLLIVLIGVPGNILMFIVFFISSLRKLSVSMYFRAMALANIYININWVEKFLNNQFGFVFINQSNFACKASYFTLYVAFSFAAWLMVAANLDRFLVIAYSTRFQFIRKNYFPLGVVLFILIYNILFYAIILVQAKLNPTFDYLSDNSTNIKMTCFPDDYLNSFLFFVTDMINSTVIPFLFIIFFTISTLIAVHDSHRQMQRGDYSSRLNHKKIRDLKFAVTMILTNVIFLALNAPYAMYVSIFAEKSYDFEPLNVLLLMSYFFFSIQFYSQLAVNSLIRKKFRNLLATLMMKCQK